MSPAHHPVKVFYEHPTRGRAVGNKGVAPAKGELRDVTEPESSETWTCCQSDLTPTASMFLIIKGHDVFLIVPGRQWSFDAFHQASFFPLCESQQQRVKMLP